MMWIEINLLISNPFHPDESNGWQALVNSDSIVSFAPNHNKEGSYVEIITQAITLKFYPFSEETTNAIYEGFRLALQGQEAKFEGIGFIKPLLNEQREQLHKYLLYKETINNLTSDVG